MDQVSEVMPPPVHLHPPILHSETPHVPLPSPPVHINHQPPQQSKYVPGSDPLLQPIPRSIPLNNPVFPAPRSITRDSWTHFGKFQNKSFTDEFCHDHDIQLKVAGDTFNGGIFMIKETLDFEKKQLKVRDNIRLLFPIHSLYDCSLQVRWTDTDSRFHWDHGTTIIDGTNVNFYGSVGCDKDWNKYNIKMGACTFRKGIEVNNRLKLDQSSFTWYHKILFRTKSLRCGFIGTLDFSHRELLKKDFLIGYYNQGLDLSLRTQQPFKKRTHNYSNLKEWYNCLILTSTYRRSIRDKYGIEAIYHPSTSETQVTGLVSYMFQRSHVKAKVDNNLMLTVVLRNLVSRRFSVSLGSRFSLKNKKEKKSFGVEMRFNI